MNRFLRELPSLNFRIFASVLLAGFLIVYVVAAQIAVGLWEKPVLLDAEYMEKLFWFVGFVFTADVAQFTTKRLTDEDYRKAKNQPPPTNPEEEGT